ncbi:MAG: DUF3048 C-terminal domain-containing protein [Anaerolineaceae bacterium]|nr:DUF3048 C-terminal domain-containing protein [Anaerolineaceae bacterium]
MKDADSAQAAAQPTATHTEEVVVDEPEETSTPVPTEVVTGEAPVEEAEDTPEATPTDAGSAYPMGPNPEDFGENINPLTGLPVDDPTLLQYLPALISLTNWPVTARPQAGLNSASMVYELYIGSGMSRFLAAFYGEYPDYQPEDEGGNSCDPNSSADSQNGCVDMSRIGPIRSGRLPFESLRLLNNGFLVMASAYSGVAKNLSSFSNIYGSDSGDINSAMIPIEALREIAINYSKTLEPGSLSGNVFDPSPPSGGKPADTFWYYYNQANQIAWRYDDRVGAYYRFADLADGQHYMRLTDRLSGEPVTIENVVVLFANHRYCTDVAFEVDLLNINKAPALLFRNGQMYEIFWTTANSEFELETGKLRPIRFIDAEGNPVPLNPGQTWVHLSPSTTPYWEAPRFEDVPVDADAWNPDSADQLIYRILNGREENSGVWVARFYQSRMVYDHSVCDMIGN